MERFRKKDLFLIWTEKSGEERRIYPTILIEALDDACREMSYSNWHNDKFSRIAEIIRRYCKIQGIPMGPTEKQTLYLEKRIRESKWQRLLKDGVIRELPND